MENNKSSNANDARFFLSVPCYKTINVFKLYADKSFVVFNCYILMPRNAKEQMNKFQKWNYFNATDNVFFSLLFFVVSCFFSSFTCFPYLILFAPFANGKWAFACTWEMCSLQ